MKYDELSVPIEARLSQTIRLDIPPDMLSRGEMTSVRRPTVRVAKKRTGPLRPVSTDADFHELFQSVYDAALVADLNGKILDANIRAVEFVLYSREELCAMSIMDIISGSDETLLGAIRENLEKDRFMLIQAYCARKGAVLFPAEITVNKVMLSKRLLFCFFIRDITLRKRAEEMLLTEHNALQNAGDGIAIADLQSRLQYVNPAFLRLWGFDGATGVIGRSVRDLWVVRESTENMIKAVIQGNTWTGELTAKRNDGGEMHVQAFASPNRDSDAELLGMVFSFVDISDRKHAEEAMRQAERHRVMLESLGAACHHLGQPATVLLTSLAMMQKRNTCYDSNFLDLLLASLKAAESLGEILHELNAITEYRTVPYLERKGGEGTVQDRILEIKA